LKISFTGEKLSYVRITSPGDKSARSPCGTCLAIEIRAPGCQVCPLPFRDPVSATHSVVLELQHTPAALRTNQIDNRGNDAGVRFSRYRVDGSQVFSCTVASCKRDATIQIWETASNRTIVRTRELHLLNR
jgi:hypothetical protein